MAGDGGEADGREEFSSTMAARCSPEKLRKETQNTLF